MGLDTVVGSALELALVDLLSLHGLVISSQSASDKKWFCHPCTRTALMQLSFEACKMCTKSVRAKLKGTVLVWLVTKESNG